MELAKQAARDFAGETYTAELALDLSDLYQDVQLAKAAIAGINGTKVKVGMDKSDFDRGATETTTEASRIAQLVSKIRVVSDSSDWDRTPPRVTAEAEALDRLEAEIDVDANTEDWSDANAAIDRDIENWEKRNPQVPVGMNTRDFDTKSRGIMSRVKLFGGLRPSVLISWKDDLFMSTANLIKRQITSLANVRPKVEVRDNFVEAAKRANIFSRGIDRAGNAATSLGTTLSGRDGSIQRKVVGLASAMAGAGSVAMGAVKGLSTAAGGMEEVATAAGSGGSRIGGFASSIATTGGAALISAASLGILLAAIMPIMAILATGVATVAAVAAGFALIGAAGVQLAKDFGTVSAANNRVADAQFALKEAQKAGAEEMKKLKPLSDSLTKAETAEKAAKDRLSKAWDTLNAARSPKNAGGVKKLEEDIAHIQAEQGTETRNLDDAWKDLTAARKAGNQKEVATQERRIAEAEAEQEGRTKALDVLWGKLDKARNPSNAKAVAAAEKEISAAEADVEKKTAAVEAATKKLESARKGASDMRIVEAERELGKAQNAQAVAMKKAAGNSEDYKNALKRLHTEASLLGPAFRKAFTPAAAKLGELTADTMAYTRKHMPLLGSTSKKATDQMAEGFAKGHKSSTSLKDVLDPLPGIMGDIGGTTRNIKSAWTSFMDVALPYVKDFTQWLEDASKRLAEWADSEQGRKDIAKFLDLAVPMAESFGKFLKTVGGELFQLAKEHGPTVVEAIELMVAATDDFFFILDKALAVAKTLMETLKEMAKIPAPGSKDSKQQRRNLTLAQQAYGGDVGQQTMYTAASGLSEFGAHFVSGPTMGSIGDNSVLYGEALSGANREYAFPMDNGSMRFITEEPSYDGDSYALWRDLGQRKGYFTNNTGPAPKAPNVSAGASRSQSPGYATAALERRIDTQTELLLGAARAQTEATEKVAPGVRDSVNHNNEHSPQGRVSVQKGLSREATKLVFEGRL